MPGSCTGIVASALSKPREPTLQDVFPALSPLTLVTGTETISKTVKPTGALASAYFNQSTYFDAGKGSGQFELPGDFSVTGWYYYPTAGPNGNPFATVVDVGRFDLGLIIRPSDAVWMLGGSVYNGFSQISRNAWHYFALVRSGTTVDFFIDGSKMATKTVSGTVNANSANPVYIGATVHSGGTERYIGYIYNVRIQKGVVVDGTTIGP